MKKIAIILATSTLFLGVAFAGLSGVQVNANSNGVSSIGLSFGGATTQSQGQVNGNALLQLLGLAQVIVVRLVPFLIGLAIVVFFWFLVTYIWRSNDKPEEKAKAAKSMGWSILAIFVMVSVWGIINFIGTLTGIGHGGGGDEFAPILPGQTR